MGLSQPACFSFYGPAIPQQPAGSPPIHFGLGLGMGISAVKETTEYWTRGTIGSVTPGGSFGFHYDRATRTALVTVSNDTVAATRLDFVGWRTFPTEQPLATMDRGGMPPDSFQPAGIEPGTILQPGDSLTFPVPDVAPTDSLVFLQTIGFANADGDVDGYGQTVTIWWQETAQVGETAPPVDIAGR